MLVLFTLVIILIIIFKSALKCNYKGTLKCNFYGTLKCNFYESTDLFKDTFFYNYLCDSTKTLISRRPCWSDKVLQFSVDYKNTVGKAGIGMLRGRYTNDENGILYGGFPFPSLTTIKENSPEIRIYDDFQVMVERFTALLISMDKSQKDSNKILSKHFFICADEIHISAGLMQKGSSKEWVGLLKKSINPSNLNHIVQKHNHDSVEIFKYVYSKLATAMTQFYLVGFTNEISIPIHKVPSTKSNSIEAFTSGISDIIQALNVAKNDCKYIHGIDPIDIQIIGGLTDGFDVSLKIENMVRNLKDMHGNNILPEYIHGYDFMHVGKNLRNQLIQNEIMHIDGEEVDFRGFFNLFNTEEDLNRIGLIPDDLHPKDKMNLEPVKRLLNERVIEYLKSKGNNCWEYLENLRIFYNLFDVYDQSRTPESMTSSFLIVNEYFSKIDGFSKTSLDQLKKLYFFVKDLIEKKIISNNWVNLTTCIIELSFSRIRAFTHYPSLYDYYIYEPIILVSILNKSIGTKDVDIFESIYLSMGQYQPQNSNKNKNYGNLESKIGETMKNALSKMIKKRKESETKIYKIKDYTDRTDYGDSSKNHMKQLNIIHKIIECLFIKRTLTIRQITCYGKVYNSGFFKMCPDCNQIFCSEEIMDRHLKQHTLDKEMFQINVSPHYDIYIKQQTQEYNHQIEAIKNNFHLGHFSSHIFILDTETTGFSNNDEIIEIAFFELESGKSYYSTINPLKRIGKKASIVHGIIYDDIKGSPGFSTIGYEIIEFIKYICDGHQAQKSIYILAHNSSFDIRMIIASIIRHNLEENFKSLPQIFIIDSVKIFKYHRMYFQAKKPPLPPSLENVVQLEINEEISDDPPVKYCKSLCHSIHGQSLQIIDNLYQ
ncbi:hypothetical protein ACTFIZ_008735 [Dictyostelium cf. discoideum]